MMKIIYLGDMIPNWFYPRVSEPTIFFLSSFLIDVGWFNLPDEKNCNVYVTGLPLDITDEEFEELMVKYGIISPDPNDTRKKKIRLYRDEQGKPKGDGRCRFLRVRSPRIFFVGERTNEQMIVARIRSAVHHDDGWHASSIIEDSRRTSEVRSEGRLQSRFEKEEKESRQTNKTETSR